MQRPGGVWRMRLAVNLGYGDPREVVTVAEEADRLGYACCWAAEAYSSDVPSLLAYVAARTERIDIGAAVFQIPARAPTATAMTAATLDALSGGRFRLGLGVSGPQVSEGWYGVRFADPLGRTREYLDIVRLALARKPVEYAGEHFSLPLPDGPGKTLRLAMHPVQAEIPTYLGAVGPKNLELAGEIADGWLGILFAPEHAGPSLERIAAGRARVGKGLEGFDVAPNVPVVLGDDPRACADAIRPFVALYVGGMGSRKQNFYNAHVTRMGFGDAAAEIQELYLDRKHREAAAAVPFELADAVSLLGPAERIADRLHRYAEAGVTTLNLTPHAATDDAKLEVLRTMADVLASSGLASTGSDR